MQEPVFIDYFKKNNWKIMYYEDIDLLIRHKKDFGLYDFY